MKWQPIETAPKDGTSILLYTAYGVVEGFWGWSEWQQTVICSNYDMSSTCFECQPTHWMPLPNPPEE